MEELNEYQSPAIVKYKDHYETDESSATESIATLAKGQQHEQEQEQEHDDETEESSSIVKPSFASNSSCESFTTSEDVQPKQTNRSQSLVKNERTKIISIITTRSNQKQQKSLSLKRSKEKFEQGQIRPIRNPGLALLEKREVQALLAKIRSNHADTVVLKIKDHLLADLHPVVIDAIIEALWKNTVCEGLYIQNLTKAVGNTQLTSLITLLKKKMIWCLNIGENYEITTKMWEAFCAALPLTNITHLYVSEHIISIELKNQMRSYIRENRQKHSKHCSLSNLSVIERCTHMWWNPINGVKEMRSWRCLSDYTPVSSMPLLNPNHTQYWAKGIGPGGERAWKFRCPCGERCSSYENYRYHPTGRMFECTKCSVWAHVECVLGEKISADDLEEMGDVLCTGCRTKMDRARRYALANEGEEYFHLDEDEEEEERANLAKDRDGKTSRNIKNHIDQYSQDSTSKKDNSYSTIIGKKRPLWKESSSPHQTSSSSSSRRGQNNEDMLEGEGQWKFACLCGETCSWYENVIYHPKGRIFCCTACQVWSHVHCLFGEKITDREIEQMKDAWCSKCKAKNRRRSRGSQEESQAKIRKEADKVEKQLEEVMEAEPIETIGGGGVESSRDGSVVEHQEEQDERQQNESQKLVREQEQVTGIAESN